MTEPMAPGLTVSEAATVLGISNDGVHKRIKRGQLRAWKEQGEWRITLPERVIDQTDGAMVPASSPTLVDVAQNVHVLVEMVRDQAEQIGMLKAELTASRQEVRALRATVLMLAKERAAEVPDA